MDVKEREWKVLQAVKDSDVPVGAIQLSGDLGIPPANIGRILLRLENQGMVEKVQNKGRVITEAGQRFLEEQSAKNDKLDAATELIDSAATGNKESLLEILEVRRLLEGYAARHCAEQANSEMKQELEDIEFDYMYELRHGRSGSEQDLNLHLKIAEYSGNRTIASILKLILTDNNSYAEFNKAATKQKEDRLNDHEAIMQAIFRNDSDAAGQEMEKHLERVIQNVKAYYEA